MKHWKLPIAAYLFVVFLSGAVVGGMAYRLYNPPLARSIGPRRGTEEFRRQYMDEMRARLNLSPDQIAKLDVILDKTSERYNDARAQHNEMVRQLREDHVAAVRAVLTSEQLPKYEQLREERDQRAQRARALQDR